MHYSEIKKHIINKKYYWGYSIIIFISLVLVYFSFYGSTLALLIIWSSIIAASYMLINIYRCRNFNKFYEISLKENSVQFTKILIEKEDYKLRIPYQSYNATIHPLPKPTNVVYIETDDFLLLFFSLQYWGIFQQVLKPFIFAKTDKKYYVKDKSVTVIRNFKMDKTEQGRAIIFPNNHGIKKVIIPKKIIL